MKQKTDNHRARWRPTAGLAAMAVLAFREKAGKAELQELATAALGPLATKADMGITFRGSNTTK